MIILKANSSNTPITTSRAGLIALRNNALLKTDFPYLINDFSQGRLLSGTTILIRAISNNELSENADINSLYDNEGWRGIYDIDSGIIRELQDNRNNICRDVNGNAISNFDWGNTSYTNCLIDNSTLSCNIGNGAIKTNITLKNGSSLNITGFTGSIRDMTITNASIFNSINANGTWRLTTVDNGSNINITGYTGGGDHYYNYFNNNTSITLTNSAALATFRFNSFNTASINLTAVTGNTSITNTNIDNSSITKSTTALALNMSFCNLKSTSAVAHTTGTLTLVRTNLETQSSVNQNTNSGTCNLTLVTILNSSYITNTSNSIINCTRVTLNNSSNINSATTAAGIITVNDSYLLGGASISKTATSISGNVTVSNNTTLESNSFIRSQGIENIIVSSSKITESSRIDSSITNTRGLTCARLIARSAAVINLNSIANNISDTITDVETNRSTINFNCTGNVNNINYSSIVGLSSQLNFTGTTGNQTLQRLMCINGIFNCSNSSGVNAHDLNTITSGGSVILTNVNINKNISNCCVNSSSAININTPTVTGNVANCNLESGGAIVVSGAVASVNKCDVGQGILSLNGGTHLNVFLRLSGTLISNNFNLTNVSHVTNITTSCTSSNTNTGRTLFQNTII